MMVHRSVGFTLIEVLLALSVLAIALTALLKASAETVLGTQRLKEKTMSHLVAMQGISMIQLGLTRITLDQETTAQMTLFDQTWYWHAQVSKTPLEAVQKITITTSKSRAGPFKDPLIGFQERS